MPSDSEVLVPPDAPADQPRILVLVPHEPTADPRVSWATQICAEVGRTDVLAMTWYSEQFPRREYDGRVYLERGFITEYASKRSSYLVGIGNKLEHRQAPQRFLAQRTAELETDFVPLTGSGEPPAALEARPGWWRRTYDRVVGGGMHFLSHALQLQILIDAMWRRVRTISVVPRVIVCHDLFALVPAIRLKRMFGCPVIYDSHECWPEADLLGARWTVPLWAAYERRHIRQADAVITVSPPLVEHLKQIYGIRRVVCVPNWTPRESVPQPSCSRPLSHPVRFLLQGNLVASRGIEMLVSTWSRMEEPRAVLYIRCPEVDYAKQLRQRYAAAIERGLIAFLPPVKESQLVGEATFADVGVIPYPPNNTNHSACCPNKFSQYLQAGLAILSTDTQFMGAEVRRSGCGVAYDAFRGDSLAAQVRYLCEDLDRLQRMKESAYRYGQQEYHWEAESWRYKELVSELFHRKVSKAA